MNAVGVGKLAKPEPVIEYLAFQELSKTGDNLSVGDEFALNDDADTDSNTDECVFALEPWLVFRWKFEDMQLMLKLRVKLMTYFIFIMKQPDRPETEETKELLATINQILLEDHIRAGFADCTDLPGYQERSSNSANNEITTERPVRRRQLPAHAEEQCQRETSVGSSSSYFMTPNEQSKQSSGISNPDNRADFCGGPSIQSLEIDERIDNNRSEEENTVASTHSNEPNDDTFSSRSLPFEEEQVPEDPCMSTLDEVGITNGKLVMNVEVEQNNTSAGDDLPQESRNTEESNERQETTNDTVTVVQRSGHGHFVPYHLRPDDQRIRRMFRQFVNRSRPQSNRSVDIAKVEEHQEQRNSEGIRERRRENRRRDW
ncbi:unnamed protein product [Brugia timori]|uniref:Uncharacterized protein n=1 Tax=Brugia timori TaxID=42155 RepID=A0A0R3Q7T4_9BILA|nr:unnamed protein product [Brugia timori]